jgi:tRNA (guanine-N7-)-methyltransferase
LPKRKLQRFDEIKTFPNVVHHPRQGPDIQDLPLKNKWREEFFKNDNPLVVELGCGKGEYTVGMASRFPDKNFIGIDLKGNRIWRGAKTAHESGMKNVAFVRTRVDNIESIFGNDEVDEIWITFPDPQPQKPRERKRLTSPGFLRRYKSVLKPGGIINLKTDNAGFYEYTLEVVKEQNLKLLDSSPDLYVDPSSRPEYLTTIKTYYEEKFTAVGHKICYVRFTIDDLR